MMKPFGVLAGFTREGDDSDRHGGDARNCEWAVHIAARDQPGWNTSNLRSRVSMVQSIGRAFECSCANC